MRQVFAQMELRSKAKKVGWKDNKH
jgi:hypothetical protein